MAPVRQLVYEGQRGGAAEAAQPRWRCQGGATEVEGPNWCGWGGGPRCHMRSGGEMTWPRWYGRGGGPEAARPRQAEVAHA